MLVNRSGMPVGTVHLFFFQGERLRINAPAFAMPAELVTDDLKLGLRSYKLATDQDRKKFGLAPKERMRDRDDPAGLAENGLATDADFIVFAAENGTEADRWWGHQVPGANVQGETMLVESLAQSSALMAMKKKYGDAKMQRFLRYELDRYLLARSAEQKEELPLARVENQQYIHYRKGSIVMYALQDYIGEENLNRAIRAYRDEWAFKGPPYSNTAHLLARIRAVTPPRLQYMIDDFFESITLYDNRAVSAGAKALPGGRYEVSLKIYANKRKAEALGKEDDAPSTSTEAGRDGRPFGSALPQIAQDQTCASAKSGRSRGRRDCRGGQGWPARWERRSEPCPILGGLRRRQNGYRVRILVSRLFFLGLGANWFSHDHDRHRIPVEAPVGLRFPVPPARSVGAERRRPGLKIPH
jgi:hypothetical protein